MPQQLDAQLLAALHDSVTHGFLNGLGVGADVLLAGAFERALGRHDGAEHAHLVGRGRYLVVVPRDEPVRGFGHHVVAALEQQRDAVREAIHVEAGLHVHATQADAHLHDERVSLEHAHRLGERGHHIRLQLLHDAQAQVVLTGRAEAVAGGRREMRLPQQGAQLADAVAVEFGDAHVGAEGCAHLRDEFLGQLARYRRQLSRQKRDQTGLRVDRIQQLLQHQLIHRAGVVLSLSRWRRHPLRAPRKMQLEAALALLRHKLKPKLGVRRDDGHVPQVLQNVRAIRFPVAPDGDAHLGAPKAERVRHSLVHQHVGLVFGDVDVQHTERERPGGVLGGADADRQASGHLAPQQRHFGAEAELAPRLLHHVFGAGQHHA
eukprot:ctg_510.g308